MSLKLLTWVKLSLVVLVAGGFVAMVLYALLMRDDIRNAQLQPPLIVAPEEPVKRRPDDAGGREFADQDKLVFDLLESPEAAQSEAILGAIPKPAVTSGTEGGPVAADTDGISSSVAVAAVKPVPSATVATPQVTTDGSLTALVRAPVVAVTPTAAKAVVKAEDKVSPKTVSATVAKPAAKPVAEVSKVAPAKGWRVQLAAVPSQAAGEALAAEMRGKFPVLKGYGVHLEPTGKGPFVRVQFVGLPNRAAAVAVCGRLGGRPCFPVAPK